jgi:hypothetical protein
MQSLNFLNTVDAIVTAIVGQLHSLHPAKVGQLPNLSYCKLGRGTKKASVTTSHATRRALLNLIAHHFKALCVALETTK